MKGSRDISSPAEPTRALHTVGLLAAILGPLLLGAWLENEPVPVPPSPAAHRADAPQAPPASLPHRAAEPSLPVPSAPERATAERAPADPLSRRAGDDARRLGAGSGFTLQFAVICQSENVRELLRTTEDDRSVFLVETQLGERRCHRVCWGRFPTAEAAARARGVPAALAAITRQPRVVAVAELAP